MHNAANYGHTVALHSIYFYATYDTDITGYLTTEWAFYMPWCAKGMHVTYFFHI